MSKLNDITDKKIQALKEKQKKNLSSVAANSLFNLSDENITVSQLELDKLFNAPDKWNFYRPLNEQKFKELIGSILENGLLEPIIVWEQPKGYMILAGHNRTRAFKELNLKYPGTKYNKISAYIKKQNELTEEQAQTIIIDTNFVQRELSSLEKTKSIVTKYNFLKNNKIGLHSSNIAKEISEEFKLTERQVYRYYKLENLIDEFLNRIDNIEKPLSLRAANKLSVLDKDSQKKLHAKYNNILDNKIIMALDFSKGIDFVIKQIEDKDSMNSFRVLNIKIPIELEDKFKDVEELIKEFFNENNLKIEEFVKLSSKTEK